ncbi:MAG: glycine--tRNA ligase subunit beta [Desulfobacterales bacterium]|nr:glycine--tRNA ligase subunit beta [Desulfobacterales bacterium]
MEKLLLEIGAEEIPAGYIEPALAAMETMLTQKLAQARIDHGDIRTMGTPRRLTIEISDVAAKQRSESSEALGPPVNVAYDAEGQPTMAARKFAEKLGLPVSRLKKTQTAKGVYVCARVTERGVASATALKTILPEVVLAVPFPKSMRWSDLTITFARPIHSVVALLGPKVITFTVGNIKSGRYTRGHYFMAPGKVKLDHADAYRDTLRRHHVIADIAERRGMVVAEIDRAAQAAGGTVLEDAELVDIVTNLVEYPIATTGRFEKEFLEVPRDVLITAMREHQKYFAVVDAGGELLPAFIAVNNTRTRDLDLVATGHERVLRARLSDAQFFYRADLQVSADQRVAKLDGVLFQAELGSMQAKVERIARNAVYLAEAAGGGSELVDQVRRAARLCKSDLVSQVVGEFPKLQGVMGRVYAVVAGEKGDIPAAIEEHYRPTRSGGDLPGTLAGALVSVADKLDSICGCFCVGLEPTGAADPYALRRQAIGVIQIMRQFDLAISLKAMIDFGLESFGDKISGRRETLGATIETFFQRRIERILTDAGAARDSVQAVAAVTVDHIPFVWKRVEALDQLRRQDDFEPLAIAFKRVVNILQKANRDPFRADAGEVNAGLFEKDCESELLEAYQGIEQSVGAKVREGAFYEALLEIAELKSPVDAFFDGVMVMAEDEQVRANRMALLARLAGLFIGIADFSRLST